MRLRAALTVAIAASAMLAACTVPAEPTPGGGSVTVESPAASPSPEPAVSATVTPEAAAEGEIDVVVPEPFARPDWLGTTALEKNENGVGDPVETPEELRDRRLAPREGAHPDPATDEWSATVSAVPEDVLARSSWRKQCPVEPEDLSYIVMTFWGFDGTAHTGEMITSAEHAENLVSVFEKLYERRFPIEEMRVTTWAEVNGTHYGDQNVTISFECRKVTGGYDFWSQHAYGLAVDINPFHNPWQHDGYVFPELASAYLDRDWLRPGMIETQMRIVKNFEAIGWSWGGNWDDPDDWMHFSAADL